MMNFQNEEINPVETLKLEVGQLLSVSKRALKRVKGKLVKQEEEYLEAEKSPHYSQIADSLLAHPEKSGKGASSCLLENIHTQEEEQVALDPAQSVFVNVENYYKKARKGKRGLAIIREKLVQTREEESAFCDLINKLDDLKQNPPLEQSELQAMVSKLRAVLEERGALPRQSRKHGKPEAESVPYRRFNFDGWEVFVGKNDAQNDELTTRFAKPWDIWMHVAASAGSHVVLRRDKNAPWPPRDILVKVASLCVWFSKAKHTSYSEVHLTEARFVRKRRHAPPGEVVVDRCKTLRVSPKSPQDFFGGDFDK
jgi:predicted ribosome quality control (RQC) complex YloA/Tae2 family protein